MRANSRADFALPIGIGDATTQPLHQALVDALGHWPHLKLLRLPTLPQSIGGILYFWNKLCSGSNSELETLHIPGVNRSNILRAVRRAVTDHLPQPTPLNVTPSSAVPTEAARGIQAFLRVRSGHGELIH